MNSRSPNSRSLLVFVFREKKLGSAFAVEPSLAIAENGPAQLWRVVLLLACVKRVWILDWCPRSSVLRNQIVGSRVSGAGSGPRLATLILIRMSSTSALAYSTKTSKYRSSLKTPVSISSNSADCGHGGDSLQAVARKGTQPAGTCRDSCMYECVGVESR